MQRQPSQLTRVAKAGAAGACGTCLVVFGIFFLIPGPILIAMSNHPSFQDDFFEDHNNTQRVIGVILLVAGLLMILIGIGLCIYVCRSPGFQSQPTQGVVISGGGSGVPMGTVGGPTVTGTGPQGYAPVPQGPGYPPAAGYGPTPTGGAYPPAGPGYPTGPAYPPPGQTYPPAGTGYPPQQPMYPNKSEGVPGGPSAPPPSYADYTEKNYGKM